MKRSQIAWRSAPSRAEDDSGSGAACSVVRCPTRGLSPSLSVSHQQKLGRSGCTYNMDSRCYVVAGTMTA